QQFQHTPRKQMLTETLVTVQQLDKNMNNLHSWLTRIEAELAKPIHYSICHRDEIQKRLAEQQVSKSRVYEKDIIEYSISSNTRL
uniref:Dystrophin n=1 Tax=Cyprinus carpio carpio TaxID=630221 RepID=A0A8C1AD50_CYPCA